MKTRFAFAVLAASITALVIGFGATAADACVANAPAPGVTAGEVVCAPSPSPTATPTHKPTTKPSTKPSTAPHQSQPPVVNVAQAPIPKVPFTFPSVGPSTPSCVVCDNREDIPGINDFPVNAYRNLFARAVPKPGHDTYLLKIIMALVLAGGGTIWLRQARVRASMIGLDEPTKLDLQR